MRQIVTGGLSGVAAEIVGITPIPTTDRVTVGLVVDATSAHQARERIVGAIRADNEFAALGWSVTALYPAGSSD
jgi:hypothetical protein